MYYIQHRKEMIGLAGNATEPLKVIDFVSVELELWTTMIYSSVARRHRRKECHKVLRLRQAGLDALCNKA